MRTLSIVVALLLALTYAAAPAAAHHDAGSHAPPPEDDPEEPCACDPVAPEPVIDVEIGRDVNCVGPWTSSLTVDAGAARVTVHYCSLPYSEPTLLP